MEESLQERLISVVGVMAEGCLSLCFALIAFPVAWIVVLIAWLGVLLRGSYETAIRGVLWKSRVLYSYTGNMVA